MKSKGQIAFEAHQESTEGHGLHGKPGFATTHLQPWNAVPHRQQQAWDAAALAVIASIPAAQPAPLPVIVPPQPQAVEVEVTQLEATE